MFKYHFYGELDTSELTQIILSIIHDGKIWMEDSVVDISANLIHEVISLFKHSSVPIHEKMVKKKIKSYTKAMY